MSNFLIQIVTVLWYLVAGFNGAPKDYTVHCEPTAIWYYDGYTEKWHAWFPQFEDPNYVTVPEAYGYMIDWMYVQNGYWIACSSEQILKESGSLS